MKKNAKHEKGDLLKWYWEDEELIGLFLGTRHGKYLIYVFDVYFKKTDIRRYKNLSSLNSEWKKPNKN
jgi:hypothetical protein